ncbi:MAG: exosortase-dependent surface protein XDP2 [Pseudomonadota bacterium]
MFCCPVSRRPVRLFVFAAAATLLAPAAQANTLLPTFMSVDVPIGTQGAIAPQTGLVLDQSTPLTFTDDVYLNTLRFGSTSFSGSSAFTVGTHVEVLSNRGQVNVEWGDDDGRSTFADPGDGDPNPMAAIGQPDSQKETTDPAIQDAGLLRVFNTLSLTEMTDGEGGAAHSFKVRFSESIADNDAGVDDTPEIVIFERGRNDRFEISLIIGGTFAAPILSDPLQVNSASFARMGIRTNTTEIGSAQDLGIGGFDLNEWGIADGQSVFGFVYSGTGADLSGIFASREVSNLVPPISPVPLPAGAWFLLAGLSAFAWMRRRAA